MKFECSTPPKGAQPPTESKCEICKEDRALFYLSQFNRHDGRVRFVCVYCVRSLVATALSGL